MKTKLIVLIILAVIAALVISVLNAPRQEIKPREALPPPSQEKQAGSTASEYQLQPSVKTGSAQAPVVENKPIEKVTAPSDTAKKITAKGTTSSEESGDSQEGAYNPRKYPSAKKMQQMQERGISLY